MAFCRGYNIQVNFKSQKVYHVLLDDCKPPVLFQRMKVIGINVITTAFALH